MSENEKATAFRELFSVRDFGQFLDSKRNKGELMDAPSSYSLLLSSLSDDDIVNLQNANVKFSMIAAPASHIVLPEQSSKINLLCFEKHCLDLFDKNEVVAIVLHEIGHVLNPNLSDDKHEFSADDFASERGFKDFICSSLKKGIEMSLPGFRQGINQRRIERLNE